MPDASETAEATHPYQAIAAAADGDVVLPPPPLAPAEDPPDDDPEPRGARKGRTPARDRLLSITDGVELWHDASRIAYATFPVRGHREHWPVVSRAFRLWLSGEYYKSTGAAIGGSALDDGLRLLESRAINDGSLHTPFVRIGRLGDCLYLDLADDAWRTVEITRDGWQVICNAPARFLRTPAARPLPTPEAGGLIEDLRPFLNVRSDADFMLVVAWLVAALRDHGPFAIACVQGEQGSGKSIFCRLVRSLVDPSLAPIRALPKDERDLLVSAANSWVLAFDNLSGLPSAMSDALCRLATGGGLATRANYTDKDETIFEATRPLLLNGIPFLTDRADLAERALTIHLRTIDESSRRTEDDLFTAFEAARPRILGALLDAVSAALRHHAEVRLDRHPRLADFAKWVTAAEAGLGWDAGAFMAAYDANRAAVAETSFEADLIAVAVRNFVTPAAFPDGWRGSATELLAALNARVAEGVKKARRWPIAPSVMGSALTRSAPALRSKGYTVERQHSGGTNWAIIPPPGALGGSSNVVPL